MITIQMTLDEQLIKRVDQVVQKLHTSRSAFARGALKEAVERYQILTLEHKHKSGYQKYPVHKNEFDISDHDRAWGKE